MDQRRDRRDALVTVRVYVEGGGDSASLHALCRESFSAFLGKAGLKGRMPKVVACGSRRAAHDRFKMACEHPKSDGDVALLLIDSERPVGDESSPWAFLASDPHDRFDKPANATDDHCHLMVVCMESWFLADTDALCAFFGDGFRPRALPRNPRVESITKGDVLSGLEKASSRCQCGLYAKGKASFLVLQEISPAKVAGASPWAKRFLDTLDGLMGTPRA